MGIGGLFLLWVRRRDKVLFSIVLVFLEISGGLALSDCIIFYIFFPRRCISES